MNVVGTKFVVKSRVERAASYGGAGCSDKIGGACALLVLVCHFSGGFTCHLLTHHSDYPFSSQQNSAKRNQMPAMRTLIVMDPVYVYNMPFSP